MSYRKHNDKNGWKRGQGAYTEDNSGLRNQMPDEDPEQGKYTLAGRVRDIYNEVEDQSSDSGNRAVRSRG